MRSATERDSARWWGSRRAPLRPPPCPCPWRAVPGPPSRVGKGLQAIGCSKTSAGTYRWINATTRGAYLACGDGRRPCRPPTGAPSMRTRHPCHSCRTRRRRSARRRSPRARSPTGSRRRVRGSGPAGAVAATRAGAMRTAAPAGGGRNHLLLGKVLAPIALSPRDPSTRAAPGRGAMEGSRCGGGWFGAPSPDRRRPRA